MLIYCTITPEVRLGYKNVEVAGHCQQIVFFFYHVFQYSSFSSFVHHHHIFPNSPLSQPICYNCIQEQIGNKQTKREIEWKTLIRSSFLHPPKSETPDLNLTQTTITITTSIHQDDFTSIDSSFIENTKDKIKEIASVLSKMKIIDF